MSSIDHEWLLNFVRCSLCICSCDHVIFLLWPARVVSSVTSRCNLLEGRAQILSVRVCGLCQVSALPTSAGPPCASAIVHCPFPSPSSITVCFDGQMAGDLETFKLALGRH